MYITIFIHVIAKCGHPTIKSPVNIIDYGDNGLPADIINFTCPPDLSLVGPNSITCTGNGEWEPDPSGVMCTEGNELSIVLIVTLYFSP